MNTRILYFLYAFSMSLPLATLLWANGLGAQAQLPTSLTPQGRLQKTLKIDFNPPRRGAPPATVGLGSRGDCLDNHDRPLTVLSPITTNPDTSPLGLTTAAQPTFLVYVPPYSKKAQSLSLRLMKVTGDDQEVELYTQQFPLPPRPGIIALSPTSATPALQVGQQYHWYASLVCDAIDQSGNATVDGWIERVQPDAALTQQLQYAAPIQRAALYGQAGIWYDTVFTLAELHRTQPDTPDWQANWENLLHSVGLGAIAQAPLLECCQPLR
jgi:hypothetical protein